MPNNKHLDLSGRLVIEDGLNNRLAIRKIAASLDKHPSTITKEIKLHRYRLRTGAVRHNYNACIHRYDCTRRNVCAFCNTDRYYKYCTKFGDDLTVLHWAESEDDMDFNPFFSYCNLEKMMYSAEAAQKGYKELLSEARSGISFSEQELAEIDAVISPLIGKSQSPHHIYVNNKDTIMISERTIYRLIDAGAISAKNIDLPRKVRFKARRNRPQVKVDKKCRIGRTYDDFNAFLDEHPGILITQLDSVEGRKGGKVLLTIHFVKAECMFAFIRDRNDSASVIRVFNSLDDLLGRDLFMRLFKVLLADNGSEFSDPSQIESDADGVLRTRMFYCDPNASFQKGSAERNHEFIRCFIPKGKSMDHFSQSDISLMMDHINSYTRESLGNRSPYDMFEFLYGQEALDLLGCHRISPNDVTLNSSIFRKEAAYALR